MKNPTRWLVAAIVAALSLVIAGMAGAAGGGSQWNSAGGDAQNTRFQADENKISVGNVGQPHREVGVHDRGRRLGDAGRRRQHGLRPRLGRQPLRRRPDDRVSRLETAASPPRSGVPGRQGPGDAGDRREQGDRRHAGRLVRAAGGKVLAFDKDTGALALEHARSTTHPAAIITQSATVFGGRVYVGVARRRRHFAALVPGLPVLQLPGQHAGARRQHRRDRLEDVHGAARLLRRRGLGQLARDRHEARAALHRDRQQLLRAARRPRLRGGAPAAIRPRSRPASPPTTTSTRSWPST